MLYIFAELFKELPVPEDYLWPVIVEKDGNLEEKKLSVAELSLFQDMDICLIVSCKHFGLHDIQLPKLAKKDVKPAIASVLEEELTEDFANLHCFYHRYQAEGLSKYLIGLVNKFKFASLLTYWQNNGIFLTHVTLDWFALLPKQMVILPSGDALVRSDMLGWVPRSLVCSKLGEQEQAIRFEDVINLNLWLVQQLKRHPIVEIRAQVPNRNVLGVSRFVAEKWFKLGALVWFGVSFSVFLVFFGQNWWQYIQNKHWIQSFAEQPSESLELKLNKYRRYQAEKNKFWGIFIGIQRAMLPGITIKTFDYNQEHLKLSVVAVDMSNFQHFKRALAQAHLRVEASQVLVHQEGIKANLDLRVMP